MLIKIIKAKDTKTLILFGKIVPLRFLKRKQKAINKVTVRMNVPERPPLKPLVKYINNIKRDISTSLLLFLLIILFIQPQQYMLPFFHLKIILYVNPVLENLFWNPLKAAFP
jgi:hypothetical protein